MQGQSKISVKQVVSAVIRNLGIQDAAKEFHTFVEWAFEAEKKIGSYCTFLQKEETLNVANKKAALPSDFLELVDIKNSVNIHYTPATKSFPEKLTNYTSSYKYYVKTGYIHTTGEDSQIDVVYMALETDVEGYPTILANHEDAIASYIMYKYKARDYYNQKLPRYIYVDLKREWNRLCAQARGNDNMPTKNQWRQISKYWNSLVPVKPSQGLFD